MSAKIDTALRDAKSAMKAGASERARDILIDVIMHFPKNSKVLGLLTEVMHTRLGLAPRPFNDALIRRILQGKAALGASVVSADAGAVAALNAKDAKAQGFHGALLIEAGNLDAARAQLEATLALDPLQVEANTNIGILLLRQEKYAVVVAKLTPFVAKKPDIGPAWRMLGSAHEALFQLELAAKAFRRAIALMPEDDELSYNLGYALSRIHNIAEAQPMLEALLARQPNHYRAMTALGNMRIAQGDMDGARNYFERVLKVNPKSGTSYYNLSRIISYTSGDPIIEDMKALERDPALLGDERMSLDFALAKALESTKELDESFFHLKRGNDYRRTQLTYSTEFQRAGFTKIRSAFGAHALQARLTPMPQIPIFVLGMMRSGTTLTEQILSSHSKVSGAGELGAIVDLAGKYANDSNATVDQLTAVRESYLELIAELAPGASYVVDKMPNNFRLLGLIRKAMPEARIIHLMRDPIAVCWSIYKNFFPAPELGYAFTMQELIEYHDLYEEMMAFWRKDYPGEFMDLDYEALTRNPREVIGQMLEFCGLDWEEACMSPEDNKRAVFTASVKQVRSGIYTGSSKAWTRWEKHLGPFIEHFDKH